MLYLLSRDTGTLSEGGGFRVEDVVGFADGDFEREPVACTRKRHGFETALTEPCVCANTKNTESAFNDVDATNASKPCLMKCYWVTSVEHVPLLVECYHSFC